MSGIGRAAPVGRRGWLAIPVVLGATWTSSASGQELRFEADGLTNAGAFGSVLASAGDLDGDGIDDVIVGAPEEATTGSFAGRVFVLSGADGSPLLDVTGGGSFRFFGSAVAGGVDVDGDGIPDLLASSPLQSVTGPHSGRVSLCSGFDGTVLRTFNGEAMLAFLGDAVAFADDLDGDGIGDVLASAAIFNGAGGSGSGKLYAWSSISGTLLWSRDGSTAGEALGTALALVGDVDGDAIRDVVVSAPFRNGLAGTAAGAVELLSGSDGQLLATFDGAHPGDEFGASLAFAGDSDGDSTLELLVGIPGFDSTAGIDCGRVERLALAGGAPLQWRDGSQSGGEFGRRVAAIGDFDGDGLADFAAGAPLEVDGRGATTGSVTLFDVAGRLLHRRVGSTAGDRLGTALVALGDGGADGLPELAFGSPGASGGGTARGEIRVEGATRLFQDTTLHAATAGDAFTVTTRGGLPGRLVLLAIVEIDGVPLFNVVALTTFDAAGELSLDADVPPGLGAFDLVIRAFGQGANRRTVSSGLVPIELQ